MNKEKLELIRIIGLWSSVFVLAIFCYLLGQWNATNTINIFRDYCGYNNNINVSFLGDVVFSYSGG